MARVSAMRLRVPPARARDTAAPAATRHSPRAPVQRRRQALPADRPWPGVRLCTAPRCAAAASRRVVCAPAPRALTIQRSSWLTLGSQTIDGEDTRGVVFAVWWRLLSSRQICGARSATELCLRPRLHSRLHPTCRRSCARSVWLAITPFASRYTSRTSREPADL